MLLPKHRLLPLNGMSKTPVNQGAQWWPVIQWINCSRYPFWISRMRNSAQHTPFEKIPISILKGEMNILLAYLVPPPCTIVLLCPLQGIPGGCWENGGTSGPTYLLKGRRSGPPIELENKLQTIVKSCLHSGFTPRVR